MDLQWGQTPWDNLTRDELLREVQRMWAALERTTSNLKMSRALDPNSPFWGHDGNGGAALEMARQVQEPIAGTDEQREQLYRSFFRYAVDLLFEENGYRIGFGWMVCDKDQVMTGRPIGPNARATPDCCQCGGPVRPLAWSDLEPLPDGGRGGVKLG